ncbi:hypothetical protein ANO11243_067690 [Dothideomycetidae sp. 11243]|nr:hypothetical protein ANO11243_067690 [fungal sp. No.11243]
MLPHSPALDFLDALLDDVNKQPSDTTVAQGTIQAGKMSIVGDKGRGELRPMEQDILERILPGFRGHQNQESAAVLLDRPYDCLEDYEGHKPPKGMMTARLFELACSYTMDQAFHRCQSYELWDRYARSSVRSDVSPEDAHSLHTNCRHSTVSGLLEWQIYSWLRSKSSVACVLGLRDPVDGDSAKEHRVLRGELAVLLSLLLNTQTLFPKLPDPCAVLSFTSSQARVVQGQLVNGRNGYHLDVTVSYNKPYLRGDGSVDKEVWEDMLRWSFLYLPDKVGRD